jgi:hypothetical protein
VRKGRKLKKLKSPLPLPPSNTLSLFDLVDILSKTGVFKQFSWRITMRNLTKNSLIEFSTLIAFIKGFLYVYT